MVLGGENHAGKARVLSYSDPLSCVEVGGVKDVGIRVAFSPLRVCEGVGAEVEEEGHVT